MYFSYKGFLFKGLSSELLFIPSSVRPSHPCEHSRINILQWILTKLGTYLVLKITETVLIARSYVKDQGHRLKYLPHNILVNTRIKILQWIFDKTWYILSPYDNRNPIDFQGHSLIGQRSR